MPPNPSNISIEPLLNLYTLPIAGYAASDQDTTDGLTTYFGFIDKEGNWYIQKQVASGVSPAANVTWRYAKGSNGYSDAWTGRAGLTYNLFDTEF